MRTLIWTATAVGIVMFVAPIAILVGWRLFISPPFHGRNRPENDL